MCGLGYCAHIAQQLREAQDLREENPQADENAGHKAQKTPQVLGGNFSQVEGDHAETDTWGGQERLGWERQQGEGCPARPSVHLLSCPAPSTVGTLWPGTWSSLCPTEPPTTEPGAMGNMKPSLAPWEWVVGDQTLRKGYAQLHSPGSTYLSEAP